MLFSTSQVHQNIISKDYSKGVKIGPEYSGRENHEGGKDISQLIRHHKELIMTVASSKNSFTDVFLL